MKGRANADSDEIEVGHNNLFMQDSRLTHSLNRGFMHANPNAENIFGLGHAADVNGHVGGHLGYINSKQF